MIRLLLIPLALILAAPPLAADEGLTLRAMSFNIRYGTARDGRNAWPKRRKAVIAAIEAFRPGILGVQECLAFQRDELLAGLSGYRAIGVGRDDGREKGEMAAIFFDEGRFEALADGHFWLSETPETPGSVGWDAALPRVASWVLLADREAGGRRLFVFNAHFDHQGVRARLESARLLRAQIDALDSGTPVLLLGDFNAQAGGRVHSTLSAAGEGGRTLVDAHPEGGGTLSGFGSMPESWKGARIDWILASEELVPLEATIDRARYRGRYPSDHYPVRAVFTYREEAQESP